MGFSPRQTVAESPHRYSGPRVDNTEVTSAVLLMHVGKVPCCVSVAQITELIRIPGLTQVPLSPSAVLGLFNHRSNVATAFSLRWYLGLEEGVPGEGFLVMSRVDNDLMGYQVDEISDILHPAADEWREVPPHLSLAFCDRILVQPSHLFALIDLDRLRAIGLNREAALGAGSSQTLAPVLQSVRAGSLADLEVSPRRAAHDPTVSSASVLLPGPEEELVAEPLQESGVDIVPVEAPEAAPQEAEPVSQSPEEMVDEFFPAPAGQEFEATAEAAAVTEPEVAAETESGVSAEEETEKETEANAQAQGNLPVVEASSKPVLSAMHNLEDWEETLLESVAFDGPEMVVAPVEISPVAESPESSEEPVADISVAYLTPAEAPEAAPQEAETATQPQEEIVAEDTTVPTVEEDEAKAKVAAEADKETEANAQAQGNLPAAEASSKPVLSAMHSLEDWEETLLESVAFDGPEMVVAPVEISPVAESPEELAAEIPPAEISPVEQPTEEPVAEASSKPVLSAMHSLEDWEETLLESVAFDGPEITEFAEVEIPPEEDALLEASSAAEMEPQPGPEPEPQPELLAAPEPSSAAHSEPAHDVQGAIESSSELLDTAAEPLEWPETEEAEAKQGPEEETDESVTGAPREEITAGDTLAAIRGEAGHEAGSGQLFEEEAGTARVAAEEEATETETANEEADQTPVLFAVEKEYPAQAVDKAESAPGDTALVALENWEDEPSFELVEVTETTAGNAPAGESSPQDRRRITGVHVAAAVLLLFLGVTALRFILGWGQPEKLPAAQQVSPPAIIDRTEVLEPPPLALPVPEVPPDVDPPGRLPGELSGKLSDGSPENAPPVVVVPIEELSSYLIHTVVAGDTLSKLSARYLGDWRRYPELVDENGVANPDLIYVDDILRIPPQDK